MNGSAQAMVGERIRPYSQVGGMGRGMAHGVYVGEQSKEVFVSSTHMAWLAQCNARALRRTALRAGVRPVGSVRDGRSTVTLWRARDASRLCAGERHAEAYA